jgi:hypothetical protein
MKDNCILWKRRRGCRWSLVLRLLLVLALVGFAWLKIGGAALAQENVTVYLEPSTQSVSAGGIVSVLIKIANVENLYAAEVHLKFPQGLLEVQDSDLVKDGIQIAPISQLFPFTAGKYYVDPETGAQYYYSHSADTGGYFIAQSEDDNINGTIDYGITLLNSAQPVSACQDGKILAAVTFKLIAEGTADILFANPVPDEPAVKLVDAGGNPITVLSSDIHGAVIGSGTSNGDANGDGDIDALDITKVERIVAHLDLETPGADANGDGEVNALDITKVERMIAGLE